MCMLLCVHTLKHARKSGGSSVESVLPCFICVPGTELRSPGLHSKVLYPLSCPTIPRSLCSTTDKCEFPPLSFPQAFSSSDLCPDSV